MLPLGFSITDHEGKIVRKNARYDAIVAGSQPIHLGAKPHEVCKGWFKNLGQRLQLKDWPAMQAMAAGRPVLSVEIEVQRLDGSFCTILESAIPIMDNWGRVAGATVITQDITKQIQQERRIVEALLKRLQNNNAFHSLARSLPQLVWTVTPTGSIDYINDYVRNYQGIRRQKDGTWSWEEAVHPEHLVEAREGARQLIETGMTFKIQYRLCQADGTYRWHYSQTAPIRNRHGRIIKWLGITRDIHDQKTIEQALLQNKRSFR